MGWAALAERRPLNPFPGPRGARGVSQEVRIAGLTWEQGSEFRQRAERARKGQDGDSREGRRGEEGWEDSQSVTTGSDLSPQAAASDTRTLGKE